MSSIQNPWKGLSTYTVQDSNSFVGREKEIRELCSLIENNLITTLYGKSGIGKSSLLNAGVTPELNLAGYTILHVNVRDVKNTSKDFISAVVKSVSGLLGGNDAINDNSTLWEILHQKYLEKENIYPIIIFDQFEELFSGIDDDQVNNFILQIAELRQGRSKARENDATEYTQNNNFRVVLSMREDDLYKLEDCIDKHGLYSLKDNRFRLRSLSKEGVHSIVKLGEQYFADINKSIDSIWEQLKDNSGNVDSATLSLLCYRLFEKAKNRGEEIAITENDIKAENDPLYNLYSEEIESLNLSRKEQIFIENHLITASGRRDITSLENLKRSIGAADKLLENSDSHKSLFRIIDKGEHVELLHDSLAKAVYKYRQVKNDELRSKYRKVKEAIANVLLFLVPVIAILRVYCCCILKNATTTTSKGFVKTTELPVILLLAPIFCCIFVVKEKRLGKIIPMIPLLLIMSINAGLLKYWFGIDLLNIFPFFYHNAYLQKSLFICFLIYTCFLFDTKKMTTRVLSIVYINAVTLACLWFGFGYDLFNVNNVVKRRSASTPWAYSIVEKDNKYGFVDWHGNGVIPCEFDELIPTLRKSDKGDPDTSFIMAKRVRSLNINNKMLSEILNIGNAIPPLYYNNNTLYIDFNPHYENQLKNYSINKNEEERLVSKILTNGRLRVIQSFNDKKLLYDKGLSDSINKLFTLHKDSLRNIISIINIKDTLVTDEMIKDIRSQLCKCICTLHLLETFGKREKIEDNDIAHAIRALQVFSVFEVMDERLHGFHVNMNTTLDVNLKYNDMKIQTKETMSFSLEGINRRNARDLYSAFNTLYAFDIGIHQNDFQKRLREEKKSANQAYNGSYGIEVRQKKQQSVELMKRNKDVFGYENVIKPLIQYTTNIDIPDHVTTLTDIAQRLAVMGKFRGVEIHDSIDEQKNVQERTAQKMFQFVSSIDSIERKHKDNRREMTHNSK